MEGNRKLTIKEIAALANTSKTTVSFYLNGKYEKMSAETRKRIEKIIKDTNYRPSAAARSLNAKSMKLIGVIIGDITNTFAGQLVKGIGDTARDLNYQLIVGNSNYDSENEEMYVNRMIEMGVDGFIVQPTTKFHKLVDKIKRERKEIVFIDSQISVNKDAWVKTNNYEAVLDTTEEMLRLGYDDFLMFTADPSVLSTRQERTRGFIDALELAGKTCKTIVISNDITSGMIAENIQKHVDLNRKTLIFAANCWLLPIVYVGLKSFRVFMPDKIGLFGFDNLEWSDLSSPSVTTIIQPAFEEGKHAVKILIDSIESINKELPNQVLNCTVNWGESTHLPK